jgi:hypothetical protein
MRKWLLIFICPAWCNLQDISAQTEMNFRSSISTYTGTAKCAEAISPITGIADYVPPACYFDIWGYNANGREYAIIGVFDGTSFIDITDPTNPVEVGFVNGSITSHRDMKTNTI